MSIKLALAHSISLVALGLTIAGPTPATARAIYIDESQEGQPPTVSSDDPTFLLSSNVTSIGPEAWSIFIFVSGSFVSFPTRTVFELTEPSTGKLSDQLLHQSAGSQPETTSFFSYHLFSDDENGNTPGAFSSSCATNSLCSQAAENGGFQLAFSGSQTTVGTFDVYLKSDVEAVPEPMTLMLLGTGGAIAAVRRIKRMRS